MVKFVIFKIDGSCFAGLHFHGLCFRISLGTFGGRHFFHRVSARRQLHFFGVARRSVRRNGRDFLAGGVVDLEFGLPVVVAFGLSHFRMQIVLCDQRVPFSGRLDIGQILVAGAGMDDDGISPCRRIR